MTPEGSPRRWLPPKDFSTPLLTPDGSFALPMERPHAGEEEGQEETDEPAASADSRSPSSREGDTAVHAGARTSPFESPEGPMQPAQESRHSETGEERRRNKSSDQTLRPHGSPRMASAFLPGSLNRAKPRKRWRG